MIKFHCRNQYQTLRFEIKLNWMWFSNNNIILHLKNNISIFPSSNLLKTQATNFKHVQWHYIYCTAKGVNKTMYIIIELKLRKNFSNSNLVKKPGKGLVIFSPLFSTHVPFFLCTSRCVVCCIFWLTAFHMRDARNASLTCGPLSLFVNLEVIGTHHLPTHLARHLPSPVLSSWLWTDAMWWHNDARDFLLSPHIEHL